MDEFKTKITLHVPEFFHDDTGLFHISEDIIDTLYIKLMDANYDFFVTTAETYYHHRTYTTKLITSYTRNEDKTPIQIFKQWFRDNNDKLHQESFAYEWNNSLFIEKL